VVTLTGAQIVLDLTGLSTRDANAALRALPAGSRARLVAPAGRHNLAVGLSTAVAVQIEGPAGYYTGGLGAAADVTVCGAVGWGAGENLMSGSVVVHGDASQSAASSARGGLVAVHGNASLRAGISLKGGTLAVAGDVGAYCGFLAQAGTILVGGDAGPALGESLYEAVVYVAGRVGELGTDARIEELTEADVAAVRALAVHCGFDHVDAENVTRVASAKELYHFSTQHAGSY
jgi:glutamate synthase domain-containing protein 3